MIRKTNQGNVGEDKRCSVVAVDVPKRDVFSENKSRSMGNNRQRKSNRGR